MPLGLGGVGDMHQGGNVVLAGCVGCFLVGLQQRRVIPGLNLVEVVTAVALLSGARHTLKTLQNGGDIFFHHLELIGY